MKTNMVYSSIIDTKEANEYVRIRYGTDAEIVEVPDKRGTRYKFVNVSPMKNFKFTFKSVEKAMNALFIHENGYVGWKKRQKKNK